MTNVKVSRHIHHLGNYEAVTQLEKDLKAICGAAKQKSFGYGTGTYYNVEAEIKGQGNDLVVIGAHLDSTASSDKGFKSATEPAPGADDDWSGVTAVLAVAETLRKLADQTTPKHTIRFVLFNAEEQGMRGSFAYARDLKQAKAGVVAMIEMDMIAWHPPGNPPFTFEIHGTGIDDYKYAKPGCDALVATLDTVAKDLRSQSKLKPELIAQVYPLPKCKDDPASGYSDHSRFQYHNWPACLVSEDMWVDVCASGPLGRAGMGNPYYHTASDLDQSDRFYPDYLAGIAQIVASAAWMIANP